MYAEIKYQSPPELQTAISKNRQLLPISNMNFDNLSFDHIGDYVSDLFGGRNQILIFPQSSGNKDLATSRAEAALTRHGARSFIRADKLTMPYLIEAASDAQGIFITGGNTWKGSREFHRPWLAGITIADIIRERAQEIPVGGWSAGAMLQAEVIGPCEDPVVVEKSNSGWVVPAQGLNLIAENLSIFPHFADSNEAIVSEYIGTNPNMKVLALRDGVGLYVNGEERMELIGKTNASLYIPGQEIKVLTPGTDIKAFLA